jgi:hypothetical protein
MRNVGKTCLGVPHQRDFPTRTFRLLRFDELEHCIDSLRFGRGVVIESCRVVDGFL